MAKSIAAVGYIRMSTDKQETSPEQQRSEILSYAQRHGYTILKWFEDLGISGDKTEKRIGFQAMIADASEGRFKAILCWDQDRFGRFDSLESGYWIHPLRKNHVQLVTCTEGPIDWNSFAGRMLYGMKQEGKHQFLVDLSNNVSRRMNQIAREGLWVAGKPPVGYIVDTDKKLRFGPPEDVQLVRNIFEKYLQGMTTRQLATWVNSSGFRSARGSQWSVPGITSVLKNDLYTGRFTYGKRQLGGYQPRSKEGKFRDPSDWIVLENNHEAIVTPETFAQVQAQLKERKRHTSVNSPAGTFVLSGLLRCSHCGASMHADGYNGCTHYTCGTYKQRPGECERYNVRQSVMLPIILKELKGRLFSPEIIRKVKAEMLSRLETPTQSGKHSPKAAIDSIDAKIAAAEARLVEVSKDMIPRVESQIRSLSQQREALAVQTVDTEADPPRLTKAEITERIESAMTWFRQLEKITDSNSDKLRPLLTQCIERVDLRFERGLWGKSTTRYKCELVGGCIFLNFGKRGSEFEHKGPLIRLI
jgi:DNA invertase Pin-like site-specific DNA recombinase